MREGAGAGEITHLPVLFVHAHPDDDSLSTGGTIARCVRLGHAVTVVTCTQGEEGLIGPPELRRLGADKEDRLGRWRAAELAQAMCLLGVDDHRFLGGPGRYRDSGRMGAASNDRPGCFWQADAKKAATQLAAIIREIGASVVITYDTGGGYTHPDHIKTHQVTMRAVELAADPDLPGEPHTVRRVMWIAASAEVVAIEFEELRRRQAEHPYLSLDVSLADYVDGIHPASEITCEVDLSDEDYDAKCQAVACYRSQVDVHGRYWTLATGRGMRILDKEWYIEVLGPGGVQPTG